MPFGFADQWGLFYWVTKIKPIFIFFIDYYTTLVSDPKEMSRTRSMYWDVLLGQAISFVTFFITFIQKYTDSLPYRSLVRFFSRLFVHHYMDNISVFLSLMNEHLI